MQYAKSVLTLTALLFGLVIVFGWLHMLQEQVGIDGLKPRVHLAAGCVVGAIALAPMLWRRRADAKERQEAARQLNVHQE